jgi:hypothetical protein
MYFKQLSIFSIKFTAFHLPLNRSQREEIVRSLWAMIEWAVKKNPFVAFFNVCWWKNYCNLIVKCWKWYLLFRNNSNGPWFLNSRVHNVYLHLTRSILAHCALHDGMKCDTFWPSMSPTVLKYRLWLNSENELKVLFDVILEICEILCLA